MLGSIRGGATSVAKYVSMSGVPPMGYAFWQSLLAAAMLLLVRPRSTFDVDALRREWRVYVVCGLVGAALPNALFFTVVRHIPAGYMAVILTTVPLMTYAFVLALSMERLDAIRALGIAIGFAGAVVITLPYTTGGFHMDAYALLAFLCPACYAVASIYVARHRRAGTDPLLLAAGTQVVSASLLLPAAVWSGQFHPLWNDPGMPEALIFLHGLIAATAYALFFKIIDMAGPVFYSQSAYVIAVTGIGWGMLVFGESHGGGFWVGVALILVGLSLVNARQPTRGAKSA